MPVSDFASNRCHSKLINNSNFLILWIGQTVSQFGDVFFRFAITIWIMRTAGIPALAGVMMMASIPGIILGPIAGTLVDNINRKYIIVISDLIRGVITLIAAWIMTRQSFSIGSVYAMLILFGIVSPLFDSAISASTPNIVNPEHLRQANSLKQASSSGTGLVGPALAAIIITGLGEIDTAIPIFFLLNGLSYILSGVSELFLKLPATQKKTVIHREAIRSLCLQLAEGVKYIWQSGMLVRIFIMLAAVNFFMAPIMQVVIPAVIIDMFNLDEFWLGFIQSGVACGFMLASVTFASINKASLSRVFNISVLFLGIGLVFLGLAAGTPLYTSISGESAAIAMILIGLIIGASAALTNVSLSTILQRIVPDEKRGRVFGCLNTIARGLIPASLGMAGIMSILMPLFVQPLLGGVAVISASIFLSKIRELHRH